MRKTQFVDQLKEGDRLDDFFLVKTARLSETRAGKPYLILEVADRSGEIGGPIWDQAEEFQGLCQVGQFVHLSGQVQSYRDKLQLKIDAVRGVDRQAVDLADFVLASGQDLELLARDLQTLVTSVKDPYLKKLLRIFFKNEPIWQRFQEAPAAKGIHHAYVGGLLEHSLSVALVADKLAAHYAGVDRSLLLAGALLHDVGKVEELAMDLALIDYTAQGRLKGHLVMGSEMVAAAARSIKDFPAELLTQLQHLILSHHGRHEFGSPTVPMTVEAFLLSFVDDLDAKMNLMEQLRKKIKGPGLQWTEYQRSLERYLYLGPFESEDAEAEERADDRRAATPPARQQTLF
ncbi:MAG: HD domain-containing protein [Desulfoarculaceae bacterium]|nr:HD domain-containing protein [Desulfoarculaceae bacterium]